MQLWEGRSCIPCSKRRAHRGKEGADAGEPWDLTVSNLGSTGSWKGSVSPAVFIIQCCCTQETHFVSELFCTEPTVSLSPLGVFCTRYASVLQTLSALTAALRHTFAAGSLCRAWHSLVSHPLQTGAEFLSLGRVLWAQALAHMAAHLSWLVMRRSSCGWIRECEEQRCSHSSLNILSKPAWRNEAQMCERKGGWVWRHRLTGRLKQIVLGSKHIVPLLLACVLPRGICSL